MHSRSQKPRAMKCGNIGLQVLPRLPTTQDRGPCLGDRKSSYPETRICNFYSPVFFSSVPLSLSHHWEIKGRFRKRVVLANVPSFRFSFRGNIRRNHPFGNHPFVNTKKGHWEIKGRFPKGWFWRTYPRSGFRSGGTSAKTTLLETILLRTPDLSRAQKGLRIRF